MTKWKARVFLFIAVAFVALSAYSSGRVIEDRGYSVQSRDNKRKITHIVSRGENLSSILKRYSVSLKRALSSNRWLDGTDLSLSLDAEIIILRKDMGSASARDIDRAIRIYLEDNGFTKSTQKVEVKREEVVPTVEIVKPIEEENPFQKDSENITRKGSDYIFSGEGKSNMSAVKVALLLPLFVGDSDVEDGEFASFYKGALIALKQLKEQAGITSELDIINTGEGITQLENLIYRGEIDGYDIVIGPVYSEQFDVVSNHLYGTNTTHISPLTTVNNGGRGIYQVAPVIETRYNKFEGMFDGKNVIHYKTDDDDNTFYEAIDSLAELSHKSYVINKDSMENVEYLLYREVGMPKFLGTLNELIRFKANITKDTEIEIDFFDRRAVDSLAMDSLMMDSLRMDSLRQDSLFDDNSFNVLEMAADTLMVDSMAMDSLATDSIEVDTMMYYRIRFVNRDTSYYDVENDTVMVRDSVIDLDGVINNIPLYAMEFISNPDDILEHALSTTRENVIVVGANNHADIEAIMSKIAALSSRFRIRVIGSPEFARVSEDRREDYFRSNTHFITGYHTDRVDVTAKAFETNYIDMYGEIPTLFSYRAYDIVALFVSLISDIGKNFDGMVEEQLFIPMRAGYRFVPYNGLMVNTEWMLVNYKPNYTIEVE